MVWISLSVKEVGEQPIFYHMNYNNLAFDLVNKIHVIKFLVLLYSVEKATISNDGATIMKLLDIVHPAAKTLVDIARSQDAEVGLFIIANHLA